MRQLCVPRLAEDALLRNVGCSCKISLCFVCRHWKLSKRKRLALSCHGLCKGKVVTIRERAATFAKALWQSIANVQVIVWLDNFKKQRFGPNRFQPDLSLDTTVLAILHTMELPLFGGPPTLLNSADNVDGVAAGLVAQLDAMVRCAEQVCDQVQRTFVRVPLDIVRKDVRSLLWRPFMISPLRVGRHVELLKLIKMLEVVQIETRRCLPLLIDMKVHDHFCKMMLGQSYNKWYTGQLLISHPLVYGVWYPYKYVVTTVYRLFQPLFKLVERVHTGFKSGENVYSKRALLHMQKNVPGLVMAAKDVQGTLNSRLQHLEGGVRDRHARVLLQGLKTLMFSYAPLLLEIGTLVRGCNWDGRRDFSGGKAQRCLQLCLGLFLNAFGHNARTNEYVFTTSLHS